MASIPRSSPRAVSRADGEEELQGREGLQGVSELLPPPAGHVMRRDFLGIGEVSQSYVQARVVFGCPSRSPCFGGP